MICDYMKDSNGACMAPESIIASICGQRSVDMLDFLGEQFIVLVCYETELRYLNRNIF
jgi:hypothetical protein